jgi:HEAT repeat protein
MAESRTLTTIGVAVIAACAFGLWSRWASQAPPPAEQTALRWPAGIESKADVGFHARVESRVVKRSVDAVALKRPPREDAEDTADRLDEEQQRQEDAAFMALRATALHANDPAERIQALKDLDEFDAERTKPILLQAFSDADPQVRVTAVSDLAWNFGTDAPFEPLAQAAADGNPEVRLEALQALDRVDDERKMAVIKGAMQDPDEDVRDQAKLYAFMYGDDDSSAADDEAADDEAGDN